METYVWYLAVGAVAVVLYLVIRLALRPMQKRVRDANDAFAAEHPDAAKVYYKSGLGMSNIGTMVMIPAVNEPGRGPDGKPKPVPCGGTQEYLLVPPGTWVFTLTAVSHRPGVAYKSVTNQYGPVDLQIRVEAYKSYQLTFDKSTKQFRIEDRPA
ncbi:MAG: hypothetical protein FWF02_02485 [Micrococcales bacterium]|nr:hypothetical protein [Micrococcales bacterium]MCL2666558.1 hypothetical protein [Micrococcales bacterium]